MSFEVNLTKEDVDNFVRQSLLKSALGSTIEKSIKDALVRGYDSPIDRAVKEHVLALAQDLVRSAYSETVKKAVSAEMEKTITQDFVNTVVEGVVAKMTKNSNY